MKYVYILRSVPYPNQLYIGLSKHPVRRLNEHNQGQCKYTRKFMPWQITYVEEHQEDSAAFQREQQLKRWSKAKKEALIAGDWGELKRLSGCHGG